MYFRPGLRAFSETTSPLHCSFSTFCFSAESYRIRLPIDFPSHRRRRPASVIGIGELCHAIRTGSINSWSRARDAFLSPSSLASSVWTMSLSSSSSAVTLQNSDSSMNPVPGGEPDSSAPEPPREEDVVQYIVIRKDLVVGLDWPLGSVISQGCHAAVAAVWLHKDDPVTLQYCAPENLDSMHKVTLEVKGEAQLRTLAQKLDSGGIAHKLWIEKPENYATCLATKPYPKSEVASYFKKLKLSYRNVVCWLIKRKGATRASVQN